ncbi:hypothetical protein BD309DRAFT_984686 [Dichomitus squalens]|nr:hypothetical protein BD309DRAFT_984686 [Dichomitus squalens]
MAKIRQIAGLLAGLVDSLEQSFVTFDPESPDPFQFTFGDIRCFFRKYPGSEQTIPPWIVYQLTTFEGQKEHAPKVNIWVKNPSYDNSKLNRAALKKALEKIRDTPAIVTAEVNVQDL